MSAILEVRLRNKSNPVNYHIITRYCKTQKKLKNSCQNAGNRDSEFHKSKNFPGEHAPDPPRSFGIFPLNLCLCGMMPLRNHFCKKSVSSGQHPPINSLHVRPCPKKGYPLKSSASAACSNFNA